MTITQTMLDLCEEALYLVRQDVSLPSLADAPTDTGLEWVKCRKAFDFAATEILAAHDWTFARSSSEAATTVDGWPANLKKVLVYCLAREIAVQIAGRTEDMKNWNALYERLLLDARIKDLECDVAADPVVGEVAALFRNYTFADRENLPRSMQPLYARLAAIELMGVEEILASHDWLFVRADETAARDLEKWPADLRKALVYASARSGAVQLGARVEDIEAFSRICEKIVLSARLRDLEADVSEDPLVRDVVAAFRPYVAADKDALPRSMLPTYGRIARYLPHARHEILAAHPWGFALTELAASGRTVPLPSDAVKVFTVWGADGEELSDWRTLAGEVTSSEEICRVDYTRNVEDVMEWPPEAYRLLVLKLAADVARTRGGDEAARHEALYRDALVSARLRDTRETKARRDLVWGPNHYVEEMDRGRR